MIKKNEIENSPNEQFSSVFFYLLVCDNKKRANIIMPKVRPIECSFQEKNKSKQTKKKKEIKNVFMKRRLY